MAQSETLCPLLSATQAMSEPIIKVENLSKRYRIGVKEQGYKTFREAIVDGFMAPIRNLKRLRKLTRFDDAQHKAQGPKSIESNSMLHAPCPMPSSQDDVIWALKDVSFEVQPGEVLGIIGRNGAGKTTLLKILSRITEPTTGEAKLYGRVSSLLEVGTGFHPELTGRENIYLNGAILGMRKAEIDRKFDEIVDFAEIEKFIDTPVKRYSSGMYVRLAFAVAAHLEPEILFVDEVLAVGDKAFQQKCLNKMDDVARSGRTVLFVSHNMAAINALCNRAILLDEGVVVKDGVASEVVQAYLNRGASAASKKVWAENERPGNQWFRLISVSLKDAVGAPAKEINISEEASVEIEYEVLEKGAQAQFSVVLYDANGYCVFGSLSNTEKNFHGKGLNAGHYMSVCNLHGNLLNNGRYHVSIIGASAYWNDGFRADYVISFDALDDGVLKGDYPGSYGGVVRPKLTWETVPLSDSVRESENVRE